MESTRGSFPVGGTRNRSASLLAAITQFTNDELGALRFVYELEPFARLKNGAVGESV